MRLVIEDVQPEHGIIGEEMGNLKPDAEYVWVLDPIDGTQSFVTGKPLFGTLIALMRNGTPILGVMNIPALNERWIGVEGRPTTFNGNKVSVRTCENISKAWIYATSPQMFEDNDFIAFEKLRKASWRSVYGAECMAYGLLANGWVDIVCEGAGGIISDWSANPLGIGGDGTVLAAGDKTIHTLALEILAR
jgi:inositol-phosphate phosphatase/L-galactose 1-phosphate phosphatase/histidinol-phosphatase